MKIKDYQIEESVKNSKFCSYLIYGQNKGLIGTVKGINESSFSRPEMLDVTDNNKTIEVNSDLVMVIGEKTSEINIQGTE